jgi:lipopolysaccharide transport system ATP-binding protein
MNEYAIEVEHIAKIYKLYANNTLRLKEALNPFKKKYHVDFYALKNISFKIMKGTTTGFIGENGSGKSTLLKILTGIIPANEGNIRVNGKISALLELGIGFNPELTGVENIYFNGTILGFTKKEIDEKLDEIIQFAEIGDYINQPVKTYSSGMFVRLAFSVAINVDPDILIIDEALSVGDAYFQVKCMNRMRKFKEDGKTILFVSHDPAAVKTLCNEAYLLYKGNIIDSGSPDKVFDYYNSMISLKKEEDNNLINKEELRKRTGNKKMEILEVKTYNKDGVDTDTFVAGEEIKIDLRVIANENVFNPTFGIAIRDRLGNDIFGINNYLLQKELGEFSKGKSYLLSYSFKLNLGVNVYSLTVAAHTDATHLHENFDWINSFTAIKVVQSADFQFSGFCKLFPKIDLLEIDIENESEQKLSNFSNSLSIKLED